MFEAITGFPVANVWYATMGPLSGGSPHLVAMTTPVSHVTALEGV